MNLDNIWMFDGCLFYDPENIILLDPLRKFLQIENVEQLISSFGKAGENPPLMSINKKTRIATIPIQGPLMPRANPFLKEMLGATSTTEINQSVQQAMDDKGIKAVLLKASSGGGSAGGIDETAEKIAELSSIKPVFTHVNGSNGSACYYLTSQANRIYANHRTDTIGSIGTKLVMNDTSEAAKKQGIKPIVISTGKNKSVGAFGVPITADQQEVIQGMVNNLQNFFEESVLRKRPEVDMEKVNDGRSFFAHDAKRHGLIDGIKSDRTVRAMLEASIR
jgi:protease-4